MSSPRNVYEVLVGANSAMGIGELKDLLTEFVNQQYSKQDENGFNIDDDDAEEFARKLADAIATQDELDNTNVEDEAATDDDDLDDDDEDEGPEGLLPGETFEQVPEDKEE